MSQTRPSFSPGRGGDVVHNRLVTMGLLPPDDLIDKPIETTFTGAETVSEERGLLELAGRGFASGAASVTSAAAEGVKSFTSPGGYLESESITALADAAQEMVDPLIHEYIPPSEIQEELASNPMLVLNPKWLSYNLPNFVASSIPLMIGTGGAGFAFKTAIKVLPMFAKMAGAGNIGKHAFGAALNALSVGGGVYKDAIADGKTHTQAVKLTHTSMAIDLPLAFFDSALLMGGGGVQNLIRKASGKAVGPKVFREAKGRTRVGQALITSGAEAGQEVTETALAENWVLGRPLTTNVLEAIIGGGFTGGSLQMLRGAQATPAQRFGAAMDKVFDDDFSDAEFDPDSSDEQVAEELRDPALHPERARAFDAFAGLSRAGIDERHMNEGLLPIDDAYWKAILKRGLRGIGFTETDLAGTEIAELESMMASSTRRKDEVVARPEMKSIKASKLMKGDTFSTNQAPGDEQPNVYRVKEVGKNEDGSPAILAVNIRTGQEGEIDRTLKTQVYTRSKFTGRLLGTDPNVAMELAGPQAEPSPVQLPDPNDMVPPPDAPKELSRDARGRPVAGDPSFISTSGRDPQGKFVRSSIEDVRPVSSNEPGSLSTPDMDQAVIATATAAPPEIEVEGEGELSVEELRALYDEDVEVAPPVEELPDQTPTDIPPSVAATEPRKKAPAKKKTPAEQVVADVLPVPEPVVEPEPEVTDEAAIKEWQTEAKRQEALTPEQRDAENLEETRRLFARLADNELPRERVMELAIKNASESKTSFGGLDWRGQVALYTAQLGLLRAEMNKRGIPLAADEIEIGQQAAAAEPAPAPEIAPPVPEPVVEEEAPSRLRASTAPEIRLFLEKARMSRELVDSYRNTIPETLAVEKDIRTIRRDAADLELDVKSSDKLVLVKKIQAALFEAEERGIREAENINEIDDIPDAPFLPPVRRLEEGASGLDPRTPALEALTPGQAIEDIVPARSAEPALTAEQEAAVQSIVDNGNTREEAIAAVTVPIEGVHRAPKDTAREIPASELIPTDEEIATPAPAVAPEPQAARRLPATSFTPAVQSRLDEDQPAHPLDIVSRERAMRLEASGQTLEATPEEGELFSMQDVYAGMTDAELKDMTSKKLIDDMTGEGGLGFTMAEVNTPYKNRSGKLVKPNAFYKPAKARLIEMIRNRIPHDPEMRVDPEATPTPAATPTPTPAFRGITGIHETSASDPSEAEWREGGKLQNILDSGAPFLIRPWMTPAEKGQALANQGFRRRGRRRGDLTRPDGQEFGVKGRLLDAFEAAVGRQTVMELRSESIAAIEASSAEDLEQLTLNELATLIVNRDNEGNKALRDRLRANNTKSELVRMLKAAPATPTPAATPTPTPAATPTPTPAESVSPLGESRVKLVVAGGRDFSDAASLNASLDRLRENIVEIVEGGARGADAIARAWAKANGIPVRTFPADWNKHGRAAGPIRNREMAKYGDALLAAPGGRGTASMTNEMNSAGKRVVDMSAVPAPEPDVSTQADVAPATPTPGTIDAASVAKMSYGEILGLGLEKLQLLALDLGVPKIDVERGKYKAKSGKQKGEWVRGYRPSTDKQLVRFIRNIVGGTAKKAPPPQGEAYTEGGDFGPGGDYEGVGGVVDLDIDMTELDDDMTASFGISDEDLATLFDDPVVEGGVAAKRDAMPEETPEEAAQRHALISSEMSRAIGARIGERMENAPFLTEEGKEGVIKVIFTRPNAKSGEEKGDVYVQVKGEKGQRHYSHKQIEQMQGEEGFRVKPVRAGLTDDQIAIARSKVRNATDENMQKKFENSEEFRKFAKGLGIRIPKNATNKDIASLVRVRLAPAAGAMREQPTDASDLLEATAVMLGSVMPLSTESVDDSGIQSGFLLSDGTYVVVPMHNPFAVQVYEAAGMRSKRRGASARHTGTTDFMHDTGAMRVFMFSGARAMSPEMRRRAGMPPEGAGGFEVTLDTEAVAPSLAQMRTISRLTQDANVKTFMLEHAQDTRSDLPIDQPGIDGDPKRVMGAIRNFYLRALGGTMREEGVRLGAWPVSSTEGGTGWGDPAGRMLWRTDELSMRRRGAQYTHQQLSPMAEAEERLAHVISENAPESEDALPWARGWILEFPNMDEARMEYNRIYSDWIGMTAEQKRRAGLSNVPEDVQFVVDKIKTTFEVASPGFMAEALEASESIRRMVASGDNAKLTKVSDGIRKAVNRGVPMAVSIQGVIDVLKPNKITDRSFMPHPDDTNVKVATPPDSFAVPLEDPFAETYAVLFFREQKGNVGMASADLDAEERFITLEESRAKIWHQKYGPLPDIYSNGVVRSVRNPELYRANDDIRVFRPRNRGKKGSRTLVDNIQKTVHKGGVRWRGQRVSDVDPWGDIASMGQVIRDARVENYVMYYLSADNVVVGEDIVSSRAGNYVETTIQNHGVELMAAKAALLGATKVMTSHNHPTGLPLPSEMDMRVSAQEQSLVREAGLEHLGHVIVDDTHFAVLPPLPREASGYPSFLSPSATVDPEAVEDQPGADQYIDQLGLDVRYSIKERMDYLRPLPHDLHKTLRDSAFSFPLVTRGLEAAAQSYVEERRVEIEFARAARVQAAVGAGIRLADEDMAAHLAGMSDAGMTDQAKMEVVRRSSQLAHESNAVLVMHLDARGQINFVESIDIETMRDEDLIRGFLDKRDRGGHTVYMFMSGSAAATTTDTGGGHDGNIEGFALRLKAENVLDGYVTPANLEDFTGERQPIDSAGPGMQENFRDIYHNSNADYQERILYVLGKSPGVTKRELSAGGLGRLVNASRREINKYRSLGGQVAIDNFVQMGANRAIEFDMISQLEAGEDPARIPWRDLSERAFIERSNRMRSEGVMREEHDSGTLIGFLGTQSNTAKKLVGGMLKKTRGHESIPARENAPNSEKIRRHMMSSVDSAQKFTSAVDTLVDPKTWSERLFQSFEVNDLKGLGQEALNVVTNIRAGRGVKRSLAAGIRRINPFMAKWLYDTDLALDVWTRMVNTHRLGKGGKVLDMVDDPRRQLDNSRQVGGKVDELSQEYNTILKMFGETDSKGNLRGLADEEMLDLSILLNSLQAQRRVSVGEARWDKLQELRAEVIELRRMRRLLTTNARDTASFTPKQIKNIRNALANSKQRHRELRREAVELRRVTAELRRDENGNSIDRRFDEASINPGGITGAEARGSVAEVRERIGEAAWKRFQKAEGEMHRFWDKMLDISHDGGIVSRRDMAQMKEANNQHGDYMSPIDIIRHYNSATQSGGPGTSGSISIYDHSLYKRMVATTSDSRDPMLSAIDKITAVVTFVARNKAMRTFHDSRLMWDGSVDEDGVQLVDPEIEEVMMPLKEGQEVPEDYRRVHYFKDGDRVTFAVYAPIGDVLLGVNRPQAGNIMKVVKKFTQLLRVGATALSPSFIAFNIPRDLYTQYIAADNPLTLRNIKTDLPLLTSSWWSAMKASFNPNSIDPIFAYFLKWGAGYGGQVQQALQQSGISDASLKSKMSATRQTVFGRDVSDPTTLLDKGLVKVSRLHQALNPFAAGMSVAEAFEQGTRFALFKKELAAQKVSITVGGLEKISPQAQQAAVFAGRRSTVDFSRGGRAFLFLNMVSPFTNAAVQGVRTTAGGVWKHPKRALGLLAAGIGVEIMLNIMNRMNFGDLLDEEEDWRRRKTFTMIIGEHKGEPIALHMPKGDLLSAATVPFQDFMDHLWQVKSNPNVSLTDNAAAGFFDTMLEMFSEASPIEFTRDGKIEPLLVVGRFLPVPLRAALEIQTDKNFYFDREIEGRLKNLLTEDRIKRNTTDLAIFVSQIAGSAFASVGDRERNPFSPVVIDELLRSMAGEAGPIAARLVGSVAGLVTDPFSPVTFGQNASAAMFGRTVGKMEWSDHIETLAYTPFIKRFISVRGNVSQREQMDSLERAQQIMGSRRANLMRPVRGLVEARRKGKLEHSEFLVEVGKLTPEQLPMLKLELEREAQGLGRTESVARTLRSMSTKWGRAVGIIHIWNNNITNPRERVEMLRALAYSEVLTPSVLAQVILLAGTPGVLDRPSSILPGSAGLSPVSDIEEFSDPMVLPYLPRMRRR